MKLLLILAKLQQYATKSNMMHRHSAVILKKGVPIIYGFNHLKGIKTFHAEHDVINKTKNNLRNSTIIVIRWNGTRLMNSKPCCRCCALMKTYKIKNVIYSDENGEIIIERVKDIKTNHESMYNRFVNNY